MWGEVPGPRENLLGLSAQEREALANTSRPLPVEGPKFHQPTPGLSDGGGGPCHQGDPLVLNTIQLLSHRRVLDRLLDTVDTYKAAIASGELDKLPPLAPLPPRPEIVSFHRSEPEDYYSRAPTRLPRPVREVGQAKARAGLRLACVQLCAHTGYVTAQGSALALLTDAAENFLTDFCTRLRAALDHSLCLAPATHTGWADVLERVTVETGRADRHGAGVLSLGDYYEDCVLGAQARAAAQVKEREAAYSAELPGDQGGGSWPSQDEIPEMHFPSSDEGAGLEGDHATPTLDVGMQMLQSLEASGDLDTPLSVAESEALSGYSATPSPQVLTPGPEPRPAQEGRGVKKRRRSGGKFL